jgi:hypothetical protein
MSSIDGEYAMDFDQIAIRVENLLVHTDGQFGLIHLFDVSSGT